LKREGVKEILGQGTAKSIKKKGIPPQDAPWQDKLEWEKGKENPEESGQEKGGVEKVKLHPIWRPSLRIFAYRLHRPKN